MSDINFQDNRGLLLLGAYLVFREDHPPDREQFHNWVREHDLSPSSRAYEWVQETLDEDDYDEERARELFAEWTETERE